MATHPQKIPPAVAQVALAPTRSTSACSWFWSLFSGEDRPTAEQLSSNEERLGINLRTVSGEFSAGGLLFVSEPPCQCECSDRAR